MAVESLVITRRAPLGRGPASIAYEVVRGVVNFAVDPMTPGVIDLDLAETGSDGRVRFDADFAVLQPVEAAEHSGQLLYVVPNRGRIGTVPFSTSSPMVPTGSVDPGDGLLLEQGWTIAYSGWQWDIAEPGALGLRAPEALQAGRPIEGTVRVDFRPETRVVDHRLADSTGDAPFATYTASDLDQPDAVLTVRDGVSAPQRPIPRERWRFARVENAEVVDDPDSIWLEGGFEPFRLYEVRYRTRRSPVVGAGLLAVRDFVACLRNATVAPSPLAAPVRFAFATGSSQTGRFLRHFVAAGMNLDESGRRVFDGMLPHIAGARRGEFNERYGQPSHIGYTGSSTLPPYSPEEPGGLFEPQRALGGVPKTIFTNTSWEYWRSDAALNHIDPATGLDRPAGDDTRYYLFTGIDHLGASPQKSSLALANPANPLGYDLLLRAAFANLVAWVCSGTAPPESRVPRRSDHSAVERDEVLRAFAALPGVTLPSADLLPVTRGGATGGAALPCFVAAVGEDLNEVAGVRLPEVALPVASYTGWNCPPGARTLREFCGSAFDLPASPSDTDGRAPLSLRYASRDAYAAAARKVVEALVAERLLLEEDAELAVTRALGRFDAVIEGATLHQAAGASDRTDESPPIST